MASDSLFDEMEPRVQRPFLPFLPDRVRTFNFLKLNRFAYSVIVTIIQIFLLKGFTNATSSFRTLTLW